MGNSVSCFIMFRMEAEQLLRYKEEKLTGKLYWGDGRGVTLTSFDQESMLTNVGVNEQMNFHLYNILQEWLTDLFRPSVWFSISSAELGRGVYGSIVSVEIKVSSADADDVVDSIQLALDAWE